MKSFCISLFFLLSLIKASAEKSKQQVSYLTDSVNLLLKKTAIDQQGGISFNFAKSQYRKNDSLCLKYCNFSFQNKKITDSLKVEVAFLTAKIYRKFGNYDSAAHKLEVAIDLCKKNNYKTREVKAYSHFGNLERSHGNIKQGLLYFNLGDSLSNFIDDNNLKATIFNNMGIIYTTTNDYELSILFYKKILRLKDINPQFTSATYSNLSAAYIKINKNDSALFYGFKAINLKEKNKNTNGLAQAYNNVAAIYLETFQYTEAEKWFQKALIAYEKNKSISGKVKIFNNLAKVYLETNKIDETEKFLLEAQSLNKDYVYQYSALQTQRKLYELYQKKELWDKAFIHLQEYNKLNAAQINKEKVEAIKDLQVKYETNVVKQEKKLAESNSKLANENAKKSKTISWIALFFVGIVSLLIAVIFNRLKLIRKQKTKLDEAYLKLEESTKNELAVSNLKALKSQMNPHFIFNLLNSIQALVMKGDVDASYTYMTKFAKLVRQTLHFSDADLVELEDEINLLRIYLDLEKLRFSKDFEYQIIDNDIEGIEIPPLLIQPFIENALVHGLLHKAGKKTLKLEFEIKDKLICTITDNGIGRTKSKEIKARQESKHQSFSTQAIEKRFKILSETYKGEFGFIYKDIFEGENFKETQVKLQIPFKRIF